MELHASLRTQRSSASIGDRDFSGVGFFLNYDVPRDIPKLDQQRFGDVYAELEGLEHPVGFLLVHHSAAGSGALVETEQRDFDGLLAQKDG